MNKLSEVLALDVFATILIMVYMALFYFFFVALLIKEKLNTATILILSACSFLLPIILFLLNQTFHFKSTPPDTLVYSSLIIDFKKHFETYSFGVKGFSLLNYLQYQLCFKRPSVFIVFNILYYHLAVLFLFKTFIIYCSFNSRSILRRRLFVLFIILATLYPVSLIINASILRESMNLMFFSIFCYFLVKYVTGKTNSLFIPFLFLSLIFLIRPITGVCAIIALFLAYSQKNKLISIRNTLKLAFILFVFVVSIKALVANIYQLDFSLNWLIAYRETSNDQFGFEGYTSLDWDGFYKTAKNLFLLICQYLFSPLPILVSKEITLNKLIPLLDALYIMFVIILPIFFFFKRFMKEWLLIFLVFLILPALFETNISGAYRHRANSIFLLLPLVSYVFMNFKMRIKSI